MVRKATLRYLVGAVVVFAATLLVYTDQAPWYAGLGVIVSVAAALGLFERVGWFQQRNNDEQ